MRIPGRNVPTPFTTVVSNTLDWYKISDTPFLFFSNSSSPLKLYDSA